METFISEINTEAAINSITYQRPKSWGKCEKKNVMCHSENESLYKALIVLYLRHAFTDEVTDSLSG